MKGLFLATDFVSSSIISFSPSIVQAAEPEELICKHEMKEIVVTKQQCTQLHTVLKDIEIEFDRIIASKTLPLEPSPTTPRNNTWYYGSKYSNKSESLVYYRNDNGTFTTSVGKDDKVFGAGTSYGDGVIVFGIQLALTSHEIPIFDKSPFIEPSSSEYFPKGSIRISVGAVDATKTFIHTLTHLQKLLDELRKL